MVIKYFIMHHSMRTVTVKLFAYLKMLVIAGTCFTSVIAMLKTFKFKIDFENMV